MWFSQSPSAHSESPSLFASKSKRQALTKQVIDYLDKSGDAGIIFDFEDIPASDMPAYRAMIGEVNAALNKKGRVVAVTLPMEGDGWKAGTAMALAHLSEATLAKLAGCAQTLGVAPLPTV